MIKEIRLNLNTNSVILDKPNSFRKEAIKNSNIVKHKDFAEEILSTQYRASQMTNINQ